MKAPIFEHAKVNISGFVNATGKSVAIVPGKVCAIISGERLEARSDGGEDDYCSILLDGGHTIYVCGKAEMVSQMLHLVNLFLG